MYKDEFIHSDTSHLMIDQKYTSQEQQYWAIFRQEWGQLEVTVVLFPLYVQTKVFTLGDRWGFNLCYARVR